MIVFDEVFPSFFSFLAASYRTFGEKLTNGVLRETFFAHFCAGETAQEVGRRAAKLRAHGVGGILDYAAEVDLRPVEERANLKKEEKENEKDNERRRRSLGGDARFLLEVHSTSERAKHSRLSICVRNMRVINAFVNI